jgi:hypothetical protein
VSPAATSADSVSTTVSPLTAMSMMLRPLPTPLEDVTATPK